MRIFTFYPWNYHEIYTDSVRKPCHYRNSRLAYYFSKERKSDRSRCVSAHVFPQSTGNCVSVRSVEILCALRVGCIVRLLIRRVNNHHSIIMRRLGARPPWSYSSSQYQQSTNLISSLLPSSGPLRLPPPDNYPDFCVALYSPSQTHSPVFSYFIEWRTSLTRFQLIGLLCW
jgi:hypothetical protein